MDYFLPILRSLILLARVYVRGNFVRAKIEGLFFADFEVADFAGTCKYTMKF